VASMYAVVPKKYGNSITTGEMPLRKTLEKLVLGLLNYSEREFLEQQHACPQGLLNAIDLVIDSIDATHGLDVAQKVYRLHEALRPTITQWGSWHAVHTVYTHVPLVLGMTPRHGCHGTSLKIFMYRVPALAHLTQSTLVCSQRMPMCTASVHIIRYLERGSCLTDDPEEADLFFLPAYESCYNATPCLAGNSSTRDELDRCFPNWFDPEADLPYFTKRRGIDHIFSYGCNLLSIADNLTIATRQSIIVTVESFQRDLADRPFMNWLTYWKDVVVPGYIPQWKIEAMRAFRQSIMKRPILFAFHGGYAKSKSKGGNYARSPMAGIRTKLIERWFNASNTTQAVSVGPSRPDYFRTMGRSKFCLVPAGLTAWTIHLYEAFFFECIPVILSDEMTVPFQSFIDWKSLSIQLPESIDMDELFEILSSYRIGRLKEMQRALRKASCWFDYSSGWTATDGGTDGCSPYRGLLSALEVRAKHLKELEAQAKFWRPPYSTD